MNEIQLSAIRKKLVTALGDLCSIERVFRTEENEINADIDGKIADLLVKLYDSLPDSDN